MILVPKRCTYAYARYYDPVMALYTHSMIGQFISLDTIVPEPGRVFGYNRYMYVLGNPLNFNDPSGHLPDDIGPKFDPGTCQRGVACPAANSRSTAPAHDPSRINSPFSPEQMAQLTAIAEQVAGTQIVFDDRGQIDWPQTLESGLGDVLSGCGKLVDGVCGVSFGGAASLIALGATGSLDVAVDLHGDIAVYAGGGGGGYATFTGVAAYGRGNALFAATNASVDDMGGWTVHFGGSAYSGTGIFAEWITGKNGQGEAWHGAVISGPMTVLDAGYGAEIHAAVTYSWQLHRSHFAQ